MKFKLFLLLPLALALLSACSTPKKKPKDVAFDPNLQGTLDMPSFTRNALDGWPEGRRVDPYDASRVRLPEEVHSYEIGRLPSRDRREMHEAHTVYRVEQTGRWDQRLPATPMASHGVVLGIREPSHDPVPRDEVVDAERARQMEITRQLERHVNSLRSKEEQIEAFLASTPDKNKTIAELQQQKAKAEKDLSELKEEYRKAKDDLREMKERQAMEEALKKSSKKQETPAKKP